MTRAARLDFSFDVPRLQADLATAAAGGWERHFNPVNYEGEWSGVALRSNSPHILKLFIDPRDTPYEDLDTFAQTPYLRECIARLPCPVGAARLMKLAAGSVIREHRDDDVSIAHEEARLHIPIQSNDAVEFVVDGTAVHLRPGECWYVNVSLPHRLANRGETDRIHLVLDARVTPELRAAIENATTRY
jgi:hypothetical protein